ncbi:MAG: ferrous iron transport protein B [Actinomycetaceae bacterium]|nr:ferrous iron transport protein B [Actinomycetaceae bacterium]
MSCPHCSPREPQDCDNPNARVFIDARSLTARGRETVVLVGNPNVGKSTLFNAVTGSHQAVVNAPGTTVEVMQGRSTRLGVRVLDLPGTYSLVANSPDEQVVVDTLAGVPGSATDRSKGHSIDLVIVVLDASAMTRSLYLLGQVAQTGRPIVAVISMVDVVEHEGEVVDAASLSTTLGIPVLAADARTREGVQAIEDLIRTGLISRPRVKSVVPDPTAPGYNQLAAQAALEQIKNAKGQQILGIGEGVPAASSVDCGCSTAENLPSGDAIDSSAEAVRAAETSEFDRAAKLFEWVEQVEKDAGRSKEASKKPSRSDRIDSLLLHPVVGIPVFFAVMWLLFQIATNWTAPVQEFFDGLFSSTEEGAFSLANGLTWVIESVGLGSTWVESLLVNGLAVGLGVVASFFPLMFIIFLAIAILEDSGYMARAAFLGDRVMRMIGLDGRVILPLIMGFGCNLPALAATRTLPNARQRLVTTLIIPYTSCAARLTIYLMIARIFFGESAGNVVFLMYVLSLVMVVLGALVLKPFITKGESRAPLMLILPAYQMPRVFVILQNTWNRAWSFVKGAGEIIVVMTLVVWLMGSVPVVSGYSFADEELPMEDSIYGATAQALEPIFKPTGFGDWHMTGALMTGFVAKETVISSIVTSYNLGEEAAGNAEDGGEDLGSLPELVTATFERTAGEHAALAAFAFLVFVLTYTPCLATVAEQKRQIGWRWTLGAMGVQLTSAWVLAVVIFQVGKLFL